MIRLRKKVSLLLILCSLAAAVPAHADYCFTEEIFKPGAEGLRRTADDTVTAYYTSYRGATMDPVSHLTMKYTITHKDLKKSDAQSIVYAIEGTDYVIESDGDYRVLDRDGNVVIDKRIYTVMIPCNGRIAVKKDGKYGIITPTGEIIKPIEKEIGVLSSFHNGRAIASDQRLDPKKTVLVDENLEVVLDNSYILKYVADGLYAARNADRKYALMDSSGKLLTDFRYTNITPYSEDGGILVAIGENKGVLKEDYTEYADLEQYSYTVEGENLILSVPENPEEKSYNRKMKYALADGNGKLLTDWSDSLQEVGNGVFSYKKEDTFMLIDASGKKITENVYNRIDRNNNGRILGWYTDPAGEPCTDVYDSNGVKINKTAGSIQKENTHCSLLNKKYALIDEDGNLLTDFIFSDTYGGYSDMAGNPAYAGYNGVWRYYDCTGREMDNTSIENMVYRERSDFDYMTVLKLSRYWDNYQGALYNNETKQLVIAYDQNIWLQPIDYNKTLIYKKDAQYGVMDKEGNILFQLEDATINLYGSDLGFYSCTYEDGEHMLDFTGRDVFGRGYDEIIKLNDGVYVVKDGRDYKILRSDTVDIAYHTDKRAYINGAEIPCYEVDAFTAVTAEDLGGYGFDVHWNGEEKRLDITRNPEYYKICPVTIPEKGEKYTPYRDIKYSDIQVYYEGEKIKSYAIDGQMLINIEDIAGDGISVKNTSAIAYVEVNGLEHH